MPHLFYLFIAIYANGSGISSTYIFTHTERECNLMILDMDLKEKQRATYVGCVKLNTPR